MAVKLIYKDIALGADEDAAVDTSSVESFSDVSKIPFGTDAVAIATCEPNGWGLVRDYTVLDNQPIAFWSVDKSGADCSFNSPPTITLSFSEQYTTTGLTVRFSPSSMDYATRFSVVWYQGNTVKHSGTYYPDTPNFVITKTVEAFDKLVFTFEKTNLPGKRLKIEQLIMGVIREFDGDELTGANFIHEVSLISDTVPVNVLDATFHSKDDVDFVFQRKQPVEGYNGEELIGVYYIESGRQTGARNYSFSCQDAIGLLDLVTQDGGLWLEDTPLTTILSTVFGDTVTFDIDPAFSNATLRGYIEPGTTMRSALQQICFALGAVVDTSGTSKVKIFPLPSGEGAEIDPKQTYIGGEIETADTVTEVTVTAYQISDERPGEDDSYFEYNGTEYKYYTVTKHAYNPNAVFGVPENKIKFPLMYLCNLSNAQTLADNIMAYYMRRKTYKASHIVSGQNVGDRTTMHLPWGGTSGGNITKMSISVTGITVSETEMLLD